MEEENLGQPVYELDNLCIFDQGKEWAVYKRGEGKVDSFSPPENREARREFETGLRMSGWLRAVLQ